MVFSAWFRCSAPLTVPAHGHSSYQFLSLYNLLLLVRYESCVWWGEADVSHYNQCGGVAYHHCLDVWSDHVGHQWMSISVTVDVYVHLKSLDRPGMLDHGQSLDLQNCWPCKAMGVLFSSFATTKCIVRLHSFSFDLWRTLWPLCDQGQKHWKLCIISYREYWYQGQVKIICINTLEGTASRDLDRLRDPSSTKGKWVDGCNTSFRPMRPVRHSIPYSTHPWTGLSGSETWDVWVSGVSADERWMLWVWLLNPHSPRTSRGA